MTNKIQYQIHLILISKYKPLYHFVIIFLIYFFMYGNNITNNGSMFVECMNQDSPPNSSPLPSLPQSDYTREYILNLEYENAYFRSCIEELERALQTEVRQHVLDKDTSNQVIRSLIVDSNRVINSLREENLNLQEQIREINNEVSVAAEMIENSQNTSVESVQDQSDNEESELSQH